MIYEEEKSTFAVYMPVKTMVLSGGTAPFSGGLQSYQEGLGHSNIFQEGLGPLPSMK